MKRYEGLFILNTAGKEDGIKDALDKISADIVAAGGKIETVQKMERKSYARVADKKHTAGFYANVIFNAAPAAIAIVALVWIVYRTPRGRGWIDHGMLRVPIVGGLLRLAGAATTALSSGLGGYESGALAAIHRGSANRPWWKW